MIGQFLNKIKQFFQSGSDQDSEQAWQLYKMAREYELGNEELPQDSVKAFETYQKAAECGNANAYFRLGWMYFNGKGCEKNPDRALECFEESARRGQLKSRYQAGHLYERKGDAVRAFECFKEAAEKGFLKSQYQVGYCYEKGKGCEVNLEQAAYWYQKAAERNHPQAQRFLSHLYATGRGVEQNQQQAQYWCQKAADNGDVPSVKRLMMQYKAGDLSQSAQCENSSSSNQSIEAHHKNKRPIVVNLSSKKRPVIKGSLDTMTDEQLMTLVGAYETSKIGGCDFLKAKEVMELLVQRNNIQGIFMLAMMHLYGRKEVIPKNYEAAESLFLRAAEMGLDKAQFQLWRIYSKGIGTIQVNQVAAFNWLLKAAQQGYAKAYVHIARMYRNGEGCAKNADQAQYWADLAAQDKASMTHLLFLSHQYDTGLDGVEQDFNKAREILENLAHQNNAEAMFRLSIMYRHGRKETIVKNPQQAHEWLVRAAQAGHSKAQLKLADFYQASQNDEDKILAVKWYQMAIAHQKNTQALVALGDCYAAGIGVAQNIKTARQYYQDALKRTKNPKSHRAIAAKLQRLPG